MSAIFAPPASEVSMVRSTPSTTSSLNALARTVPPASTVPVKSTPLYEVEALKTAEIESAAVRRNVVLRFVSPFRSLLVLISSLFRVPYPASSTAAHGHAHRHGYVTTQTRLPCSARPRANIRPSRHPPRAGSRRGAWLDTRHVDQGIEAPAAEPHGAGSAAGSGGGNEAKRKYDAHIPSGRAETGRGGAEVLRESSSSSSIYSQPM